ncbi:hypothetical protein BBO99_00006630 [Phytophthora kernoviae]|uniref:Uncharacterized protein n=2 Tax=Phytophthora kernoviae TaxID=325452 RepID=A0A421EY44_9STRA|nr:hypothetical protein G195_008001 [Phytophthora kernoviae 00238/432]KAG2512310.1 hypothetical protein JM16_005462 [Phytophthora kernoviae]KAG2522005.1 hypothetical protein JM18_005340 [Phytophthora kernoviae]RLN10400.1 hypothetical protein BBI17_006725 [Phytophthora kernoviae]RLN77582.1 hypothetical protein BBO99_00006630 [Phytophthora kernoviae]
MSANYAMEMMHSEMELMEGIKQNEENVATVNSRIKHFKELVIQERSRFKTLNSALEGDTGDLKLLEEKRIVAEENHRKFQAAVTQRESEVYALCNRVKQQRAAMVTLRHQIEDANARLEAIALQNSVVAYETQNGTSTK